jgi:hypothetical protein
LLFGSPPSPSDLPRLFLWFAVYRQPWINFGWAAVAELCKFALPDITNAQGMPTE